MIKADRGTQRGLGLVWNVNYLVGLLKLQERLTEPQSRKFEAVKAVSPQLGQMHQQKQSSFRVLFAQHGLLQAMLSLLNWMQAAQNVYKNSVSTMTQWFGEIIQYLEHRTASSVDGGINNRLKLIKRSGNEFTNSERSRLRWWIYWRFPPAVLIYPNFRFGLAEFYY